MSSSYACRCLLVCGGFFALGCGNSTDTLIAQLSDDDPAIRRAAARALGEQHRSSEETVAALGRASQDADVEVREIAVDALGQQGATAKSSLPSLETALDDPEVSVRLKAALAILSIDPASRSYVPVLIESLRAGHGPVFLEVGRMGANAQWAVPTLVELLSHRQAAIRALAAQSLGQIGVADKNLKAALERRLRDDKPAVRRAAQLALEEIQTRFTTVDP